MSTERESIVHMRVTEPERAGMERAAAREGLRLSTWLRRLALLESRRSEGAEARRDVPRGPA